MIEASLNVSDILTTANNTLSAINTMVTTYLFILSIIVAVLTLGIQYFLSKDRKKNYENAVKKVIKDLAEDEGLRKELIQIILQDPSFQERFNALVDISVNDKMDITVQNNMPDLTFFKGLDNGK